MVLRHEAHIGADAESGLVHTVRGTSGNVGDVTEGNSLLHGQEATVHADAGYQGGDKRADANEDATWHIAMGPGKRKTLNKDDPADALIDKAEKLTQGGCACQSGAFVSGDQAPVRLCESPLPWFEEKHSAARDTICAVQFVDGAWQIDSGAEMSAPENRAKALQSVKTAQWGSRFNTSAGDYS